MEMNTINLSIRENSYLHQLTATSHHDRNKQNTHVDRVDYSGTKPTKSDLSVGLAIYEEYKENPLDIPNEQREQLKGLYSTLVASKDSNIEIDEETAMFRDTVIAQLEGFFSTEKRLEQQKMVAVLMEHSLKVLESEMHQAEIRAEQMKVMTECIKIAAKVSNGEASNEEVRYLQKHGVDLYAMAMAFKDPKKETENNETTTDINNQTRYSNQRFETGALIL